MGIPQDIAANSYLNFKCQSAALQEGGRYNLTEHVTPGYARFIGVDKVLIEHEDTWHHVVLPAISEVSPNSGLEDGQSITVKGSGFSEDESKLDVEIDGV